MIVGQLFAPIANYRAAFTPRGHAFEVFRIAWKLVVDLNGVDGKGTVGRLTSDRPFVLLSWVRKSVEETAKLLVEVATHYGAMTKLWDLFEGLGNCIRTVGERNIVELKAVLMGQDLAERFY